MALRFFILCCIVLLCVACGQKEPALTRTGQIASEIELRITELEEKQRALCISKLETKAESYVDSILRHEINTYLSDTSQLPSRPQAPPNFNLDSLHYRDIPLEPLFDSLQ